MGLLAICQTRYSSRIEISLISGCVARVQNMRPFKKQTVCCLLFLCLGCSNAPIQPPTSIKTQNYGFYTNLRQDKTSIVLDVFFRNDTEKIIEVTHGDWNCAFRFEMKVKGKKYTYPPRQAVGYPNQPKNFPEQSSGEVRTCNAMAYTKSIDKKSKFRFMELRLSQSLNQALHEAKMNHSGEFYFNYSVTGQLPRLEVYKVP
jgi:hypothetical protein